MQYETDATREENSPMSRGDLLNLYALSIQAEQFWLDQLDKRTTAYATLILALIAATAAGFTQAGKPSPPEVLLAGPTLVILTSRLAIAAAYRVYQRFLEAIAFGSQVEELLGWIPHDDFWKEKSLVFPRYLKARNQALKIHNQLYSRPVSPFKVRLMVRRAALSAWWSQAKSQKLGGAILAALIPSFLWLAGWLWPLQVNLEKPIISTPSGVFVEQSRFGGSHKVTRRLFLGFYLLGICGLVFIWNHLKQHPAN